MEEEKFPNVTSHKNKDGVTGVAYIKLNDGKSHHCREWDVDSSVILDFNSGDEIIGIEILYPMSPEMIDEITRQMSLQGVIGEEILRILNELAK